MSFRSRLLSALLIVGVSVSMGSSLAMAQQATPPASSAAGSGAPVSGATLHGSVLDPDNALIPGATVTLTPATGKALSTVSKSDGTYTLRGVAAGTYTLSVKAVGFGGFTKSAIKVVAGVSLSLDATLPLGEQEQVVTVTTNPVTLSVDPDNNASSTVITGAALDALSDDPDDLQSELSALAGPSAGPDSAQFYIDGFTGGQLPPKSSILSIRINQNPFSAQYDRLGYGRIEILTKPGTDKLHGNFMTMYGGKSLNTSSPFLGPTGQPDYHTLFFMGNVTGPIREGMSFTLSGSHRTMDDNSIINPTAFYSSSATSTTLCDPGADPNTGSYTDCSSYAFPTNARALATPATRWDFSPRLDMMLGAKNTLTTRYQYESGTSSVNPSVNSKLLDTGSDSYNNEQEIQVSETQLISSKVINETRFEYQHSSSHSTPLNTDPAINVTGAFSVGGGSLAYSTGDHVEVQNYTSVQLAKNFLRFGGRLRTSSEDNFSESGATGSFTYDYLLDPCTDPSVTNKPSNCAVTSITPQASLPAGQICAGSTNSTQISSYQCGIASRFSIRTINVPTIAARETDFGFYAEDDWKAKQNLTISYGLRYEGQNVISSTHDFAPRVSFAYGVPRKSGKTITVLRGGYGLFYNRFGLGSIESQIANTPSNAITTTYKNLTASCNPTTGSTGCISSSTGTASSTSPTINDPNLRSAYIMQSAATVEQQVGKYANLSMTYLNTRGIHQFLTRSLPVTTTVSGVTTTTINNTNESEGVFRQNQINVNGRIQMTNGLSLMGWYSASWANTNTSNISDPFDSTVDYGRASFGVRNRVGIFGNIPLPYRITASPMLIASSGSPYNITMGTQDSVTNGGNDRPAFAQGVTAATASCTNANSFSSANPYTAGGTNNQIPVNFCTGPASVSVNMRLGRTFGFGPKTAAALAKAAAAAQQASQPGGPGGPGGGPGGGRGGPGGGGGGRGGPGGPPSGGSSSTGRKYNLTISAMAQNLFNEVPYSTPNSTLNSPKFGQTTSITSGNAVRKIMLQANFSF